jgi:transcriptional regulator with XRE-family HTH domain
MAESPRTLNPRTLGVRIRRLRLERGLTQVALARQVGGSNAYLSNLERSKTPQTTLRYLSTIADLLGTSLDYLAGRTDDPTFRRSRGVILPAREAP